MGTDAMRMSILDMTAMLGVSMPLVRIDGLSGIPVTSLLTRGRRVELRPMLQYSRGAPSRAVAARAPPLSVGRLTTIA